MYALGQFRLTTIIQQQQLQEGGDVTARKNVKSLRAGQLPKEGKRDFARKEKIKLIILGKKGETFTSSRSFTLGRGGFVRQ